MSSRCRTTEQCYGLINSVGAQQLYGVRVLNSRIPSRPVRAVRLLALYVYIYWDSNQAVAAAVIVGSFGGEGGRFRALLKNQIPGALESRFFFFFFACFWRLVLSCSCGLCQLDETLFVYYYSIQTFRFLFSTDLVRKYNERLY